tara:strand:+ start:8 stop:436 length:429 start_codon:yes stop_codon:yes gene_type:complete
MGKVLLNQFKAKLAKRIQQSQDLGKLSIKIDINDVANKRNQLFVACLSKNLLDKSIQKSLVKINPYTVKFGNFSRGNNFGTSSIFYVTLSLIALKDNDGESWECALYECDDISENEVESKSFDDGKIAVEYFVNQINKLYKK